MLNFDRILNILERQGYTFELLKKEDAALHREFISTVWSSTSTRGDFNINNWKLNRGRDTPTINLLVCKKDNKIIGQMGYIPVSIDINGKQHDAVWGCNFRVQDSYKDVGIGAAIEMYATKLFPILLGNSPTTEAMKFKKGLGYKFLDGPRIMMLPVKSDYVLQLKTPDKYRFLLPIVTTFVNPLLRIRHRMKFGSYNKHAWTDVDEKGILERILKFRATLTLPHTIHDEAFINWRCNPPVGYKQKPKFTIFKNDDYSYCIYNITNGILSLYEHHFNDKTTLYSFLRTVLNSEVSKGVTTIRTYANFNHEESMFKGAGFIGLRRKCIITVYNKDNLFADIDKMYVDLYDSDGDL